MDFIFCGAWDASSGQYPIIPSNIKNGYYYISSEGTIDNTFFNVGDWLIFIWDETSGIGTFYKSDKGIVQINVNYLPKIGEKRFTYTKITVDENGNFIEGSSLTNLDLPQHKHPTEINLEFVNSVRKSLSNFPLDNVNRKDFFCNTPVSKAVNFDYDEDNLCVRADVKIDEITIVKDQFGYLKVNKDLLNILLPWQPFTSYIQNNIVYIKKNEEIKVYLCLNPHTSSSNFVEDKNNWILLFSNTYGNISILTDKRKTIVYRSKTANGQYITWQDWADPRYGFRFIKKGKIIAITIFYSKGEDRNLLFYKNNDLIDSIFLNTNYMYINKEYEFDQNDLVKFFVERKNGALYNCNIQFDVLYDDTI